VIDRTKWRGIVRQAKAHNGLLAPMEEEEEEDDDDDNDVRHVLE
jgi:hypothetical protein